MTDEPRVYLSSHTFGGMVPPHKPMDQKSALIEAINAVIADYETLGHVRPGTIKLCRRARQFMQSADAAASEKDQNNASD